MDIICYHVLTQEVVITKTPGKKQFSAAQAVRELSAHIAERGLTVSALARQLSIPRSTVAQWFKKGKSKTLPSRQHLETVKSYLAGLEASPDGLPGPGARGQKAKNLSHKVVRREAGRKIDSKPQRRHPDTIRQVHQLATARTEKIRLLLLLLENELRWFRDGTPAARETFRQTLDPYDVGYIASLLTMLGSEASFQRWLAFSSNNFRFFKKGKKQWPGR